ncbi:MAG: type II toxin-antitoxin system VapC family toxin [Candidatus Binataceae bacterium]
MDSSVWIDFLNSNRGRAGGELERLIRTGAPLVVAGVIVAEVLQGLKRDVAEITQLLSRWPLIEPGGFATYAAAAAIFRQARAHGVTLSTVDSLLAALAIEYQADLFTLDQDFERLAFSGLRLHRSGHNGHI